MRSRLLLCCTLWLFALPVSAQVNVTIGEVKKIHLTDAAGYLASGFQNEYEVVSENGKWQSYQVREKYDRLNSKRKRPEEIIERKDSVMHRFIKTVAQDTLIRFLNSISIIKPKFVPSDLKVSIPKLRQKIDTSYLKYLTKEKREVFDAFYDSPQKLDHILELLQDESWTDDYPSATIEIIRNSGDTVKVRTTRQVDYMLPWKINGVTSYDVGINHFFMAATGLDDHRMGGKYLPYHFYSTVDYRYAADAFERLRWEEIAPANTAFIKQHFHIIKVKKSNDQSFYSFHPLKIKNKKVRVNGYLKITNNEELKKLVLFAEDTLRRFLQRPAFMMDSCKQKDGCVINFGFSDGASNRNYFDMFTPALKAFLDKFDKQTLMPFTIYAGERSEDNWIALPDGRYALTEYIDDQAIGVSPKNIIPDGAKQRKFVFMLFDQKGNLLKTPY